MFETMNLNLYADLLDGLAILTVNNVWPGLKLPIGHYTS